MAAALRSDRRVIAVLQRDPSVDEPGESDLHPVGTIATVLQASEGEGGIRAVLQAHDRASWTRSTRSDPGGALLVTAREVRTRSGEPPDPALLESVRKRYGAYVRLEPRLHPQTAAELAGLKDPGELADHVAAHLLVTPRLRQDVLSCSELSARLRLLDTLLRGETKSLRPTARPHGSPHEPRPVRIPARETGEIFERIERAGFPTEIRARAVEEARRLAQMPPLSPEGAVIRTYLDWLLALPWKEKTRDRTDLARARAVLDADHEGLAPVKERILEALAVIRRTRRLPPTILAFVGPPGVGKTSLGRSIAGALGRKFIRISLGGIRDEAEVRGHRRTYVGAMPGRILQAMRRAGTVNPVIQLDEVDKLGQDLRGDPAAALLEVLDPEQNRAFSDHYLELDYDLHHVLFLVTANLVSEIPHPLRDRMEILSLPGYHEDEKVRIAQRHLVPRLERQHGMPCGSLGLEEGAIRRLVRGYTREAGVRGLERMIARLCRRDVLLREEGRRTDPPADRLSEDLGPPTVPKLDLGLGGTIGRALGLGVTDAGGEVLPVEVSLLPGRGRILVTGGAGSSLKDSVRAALTCIRARGLGDPGELTVDVHVHLPRGDLSKDGPSAGVAVALALASAFEGRPTRARVAMTGEVTLRGDVLPVGGLREKILAAWREGLRTVLFPADQEGEIGLLPAEARDALHLVPVRRVSQVLHRGLKRRHEVRPVSRAA